MRIILRHEIWKSIVTVTTRRSRNEFSIRRPWVDASFDWGAHSYHTDRKLSRLVCDQQDVCAGGVYREWGAGCEFKAADGAVFYYRSDGWNRSRIERQSGRQRRVVARQFPGVVRIYVLPRASARYIPIIVFMDLWICQNT